MQPLAVDLVLLRSTAPDLPLAVGRILAARVVERHGQRHGLLNLAGAYLAAELPDGVQPGDRLRLAVRELTADRVVLQQLPPAPSAPAQVPPAAEARAPGDVAVLALAQEHAGGDGAEDPAHVVALRCACGALGEVELRIALAGDGVHARVALADGAPLAHARERAGGLRADLAVAAGRPAEVEIVARRGPLDVYA